ncbi:MAG: tetratricopeptide repeat protein [Pseudomonadota bacterium]
MAKHLDLEEQEQLDEIKHFWKEYGNLITWVVIAVFGGIAGWNGWNYWQRTQAVQAATLYDEVDRAAQAGDVTRVERAFADMKDKFGGTTYAQQAGMLAAKVQVEKGNTDAAKAALTWVAEKSSDEGYQAIARLRLSGVLLEAKAYDDALKQLSGEFPKAFEGLAADRRGDIYKAQGKKDEAKSEYVKAYKGVDERTEYKRLLAVKLGALGVDATTLDPVPAPSNAASGTAKS